MFAFVKFIFFSDRFYAKCTLGHAINLSVKMADSCSILHFVVLIFGLTSRLSLSKLPMTDSRDNIAFEFI